MVVGAGISGMQSALDMANSGFKVYLVEEKAPSAENVPTRQNVPTNDCSMCMISPKLIEVGKHNNIELITNAHVESVAGEEGNFRVKVLKKPRFIDEQKCTSCGDCVTACRSSCLMNSTRVIEAQAVSSVTLRRCRDHGNQQDGKGTLQALLSGRLQRARICRLISKKKYVESVDHIKQWIPLPSVLGRICHHLANRCATE